jgi:hypothetical protein
VNIKFQLALSFSLSSVPIPTLILRPEICNIPYLINSWHSLPHYKKNTSNIAIADTMKVSGLAILSIYLGFAQAKDCSESPSSPCVQFGEGDWLDHDYVPTCAGNCFVYGFNAIRASGTISRSTRCHAYSDGGCQNQILDTGDQWGTFGDTFLNFGQAESMICYYGC